MTGVTTLTPIVNRIADQMPKIAASIVFPVSSPPRRNAVVETDREGTVLSVSMGNPGFREMAGVEFYSGILIPGLADVMCGPRESGHRLLASGVRVAGRVGWPADGDGTWDPPRNRPTDEQQKPAGRAGDRSGPTEKIPFTPRHAPAGTGLATWRNRYGGIVGYRIYDGIDHFHKFFTETDVGGIFRYDGQHGVLKVLAGNGTTPLHELMFALQEGPLRLGFPELLMMATMNGAVATGFDGEAGSLSPGKRPGLNIIEGVDTGKMKLLSVSRIRRVG